MSCNLVLHRFLLVSCCAALICGNGTVFDRLKSLSRGTLLLHLQGTTWSTARLFDVEGTARKPSAGVIK